MPRGSKELRDKQKAQVLLQSDQKDREMTMRWCISSLNENLADSGIGMAEMDRPEGIVYFDNVF